MKIQDPTPGLSGKYTCKVSTFENEGLVEQQLNIFGKVYILGPSKKNLNSYYSLGDLTTWS